MEDEREVNQRNRRKLTEIGKNRREETRTGGKIPILQKHSQPVLLLRVSEQLLNTAVSTSDTISVGKSLLPLIIYSYLKWKCIKESKEKSPKIKKLKQVTENRSSSRSFPTPSLEHGGSFLSLWQVCICIHPVL